MTALALTNREWRKDTASGEYLVSTSIEKIDRDFINKAFDSKEMHWAKPLPDDQMQIMLSQSLTLGLYEMQPSSKKTKTAGSPSSPRTPSPTLDDPSRENLHQIGLARLITDYITFAYVVDVYVDDDHRSLGLGKWLVECCQDVLQDIPALRRAMLVTSPEIGKKFYERELGFYDIEKEREHLVCMTRKAY